MRSVVVYESMFGDGRLIAQALAEGLEATGFEVDLFEVGRAPTSFGPEVNLLVVGAPTHATSLSRPSSRSDAAAKADEPVVSAGIGVREWLKRLALGNSETAVACWDTRGTGPKAITRFDHAVKLITKGLKKAGYTRLVGRESFFVVDMKGPLVDGEEDRARAWAKTLAAELG